MTGRRSPGIKKIQVLLRRVTPACHTLSFLQCILSQLMNYNFFIANEGKTMISEGIDANYFDIINYSVFALVLMNSNKITSV